MTSDEYRYLRHDCNALQRKLGQEVRQDRVMVGGILPQKHGPIFWELHQGRLGDAEHGTYQQVRNGPERRHDFRIFDVI